MPESDHSRFWIAAEVFLALAFVLLPAAFGGAPEWTAWLLWALASGALVAWALGASRNHRRGGWHPVLLIPLVVAGLALVQLTPLPPALLSLLSPRLAEWRDFALVPLGLTAWRPLAVDAPASARGLGRVLSLGMLLVVSLELGRLPAVRRRLFTVLALAGTATAACGFIHLLAGLDALFGVFHFYGNVPFLTPFGNTNHLSAWLLLTGTVAAGLALNSASRDAAIGWAVAAAACGVGVFFTFSRGGTASFVATWAVMGAALLVRRGGGLRAVLPWVLIGGTVLVAAVLGFEQLVERADTLTSVEKLQATKLNLWPMFARGIAPYGLLGMGPGGFELGFAPAQTIDFTVTFTHPEMVLLQWVSDVGLLATLALLVLGGLIVVRLWRTLGTHETERIALIGVLGLGLHDVFDFALELSAVAAAATIVLGLVCGVERAGSRRAVRSRGLWLAFVPVVVGAAALGFGLPGYLFAEKQLAQSVKEARPFEAVRKDALRLIDRHPYDWVLFSTVAQYASSQATPQESLAWINRVLALRPSDAASHLAAARALLRLGKPGQALGELKLAWAVGESASLEAGLNIAAKLSAWDRVLLPTVGHLERLYWLLRTRGRNEEAASLLAAALAQPPNDEVAEEARLLLVRHEADLGSPEKALEELDQLPGSLRHRSDLVLTRVQALGKLGRTEESIAELDRLFTREPANAGAALALVEQLSAAGRPEAAREVLQRLKPFLASSSQRSLVFQREASLWAQEERYPRALDALQTASRIEPARADLHYRLAEIYERMGSLHSALDEVRRGKLLDTPEGATAREAWVDRLEGALSHPQ